MSWERKHKNSPSKKTQDRFCLATTSWSRYLIKSARPYFNRKLFSSLNLVLAIRCLLTTDQTPTRQSRHFRFLGRSSIFVFFICTHISFSKRFFRFFFKTSHSASIFFCFHDFSQNIFRRETSFSAEENVEATSPTQKTETENKKTKKKGARCQATASLYIAFINKL